MTSEPVQYGRLAPGRSVYPLYPPTGEQIQAPPEPAKPPTPTTPQPQQPAPTPSMPGLGGGGAPWGTGANDLKGYDSRFDYEHYGPNATTYGASFDSKAGWNTDFNTVARQIQSGQLPRDAIRYTNPRTTQEADLYDYILYGTPMPYAEGGDVAVGTPPAAAPKSVDQVISEPAQIVGIKSGKIYGIISEKGPEMIRIIPMDQAAAEGAMPAGMPPGGPQMPASGPPMPQMGGAPPPPNGAPGGPPMPPMFADGGNILAMGYDPNDMDTQWKIAHGQLSAAQAAPQSAAAQSMGASYQPVAPPAAAPWTPPSVSSSYAPPPSVSSSYAPPPPSVSSSYSPYTSGPGGAMPLPYYGAPPSISNGGIAPIPNTQTGGSIPYQPLGNTIDNQTIPNNQLIDNNQLITGNNGAAVGGTYGGGGTPGSGSYGGAAVGGNLGYNPNATVMGEFASTIQARADTLGSQDAYDLSQLAQSLNGAVIGGRMSQQQAVEMFSMASQATPNRNMGNITPPRTGDAGLLPGEDPTAFYSGAEQMPDAPMPEMPQAQTRTPPPIQPNSAYDQGQAGGTLGLAQPMQIPDAVHGGTATLDAPSVSAIQAIFPASEWQTAYHIVAAESKGNPFAIGDAGEVGLFQIHPVNWAGLTRIMGIPINADTLVDPQINAAAARIIWEGASGWGRESGNPWATAPEVFRYFGNVGQSNF